MVYLIDREFKVFWYFANCETTVFTKEPADRTKVFVENPKIFFPSDIAWRLIIFFFKFTELIIELYNCEIYVTLPVMMQLSKRIILK